MKMYWKLATIAATGILLSACASQSSGGMSKNMAHVHMAHVTTGWKDTPGQKGLLPTALKEARIARTHVGLALLKPGNLTWMKTHTAHVQHALDPSMIGKGPGLGYGVFKASAGIAKHVNFAAESKAASANVKLHSRHVSASANNVVSWTKELVALSKKVMAANTASDAAAGLRTMQRLVSQLTKGVDANGDGKVSWIKGEGGLDQASLHMGLMRKGEDIDQAQKSGGMY